MMQHNSEIDVRAAGPNMGHVLMHLEFLAKPNAGLSPEYKLEIRAIREGAPPRSLLINPANDDGLEMALHFVEQTNRQGFNVYVTVNPAVPSGPHVKDEDISRYLFCLRMLMSGVSSAKSKMTSSIGLMPMFALAPSLLSEATFIGDWKSPSSQLILNSGRSSCKTLRSDMAVIPKFAIPHALCALGEPLVIPRKPSAPVDTKPS